MKIWALLFALMASVSVLNAQVLRHSPITQAEYFVNSDPGEGKGTPISLTQGFVVDLSATAGVLHKDDGIFLRVRNKRGVWSKPFGVKFNGKGPQRHQFITKAEYFVNNDPGIDKGIPMSGAFPNNPAALQAARAPVSNRSDVFYIRATNIGRHSSMPVAARLGNNPIASARVLRLRHPLPNVTVYDTLRMSLTQSSLGRLVSSAATNNIKQTFFKEGDTLLIQMKGQNEIWGPSVVQIYHTPAPTLAGINPKSGERMQALDVIFAGANFVQGVTKVNVGAGIQVNSVTVISATSLKANLTITAGANTGPRKFSVSNGVLSSGPQTFTVNNPLPILTNIIPAKGNRGKTLNVVFRGKNFISSATTVNVGNGIIINSVKVDSATGLTANLTIEAKADIGMRNFTVTNSGPGGGTSSPRVFRVNSPNPAPTLSSLSPNLGERGQKLGMVFTGTNFLQGLTKVNVDAGIFVDSVTVFSATSLKAHLTIADAAATGAHYFSVTNPLPGGGISVKRVFTVNNPAPAISSILPTNGNIGQTLTVVIKGAKFFPGVSSAGFGAGITVNSVKVDSATKITANLTISPFAAAGARQVTVTNATPGGGTATLSNGFTVNHPAPTLIGILPASANRLQTLEMIIIGTNFVGGVTALNVGAGITVNADTVMNSTMLKATIKITAAANTGPRNFSVSNGALSSGTQTFTVKNPRPTLASLKPAKGNRGQTLNVVFRGKNFISNATTINAGNGIIVNSVKVDSATGLTANLTIADTAATGAHDFSVTNPAPGGGVSAKRIFTVNNPAPVISRVLPGNGAIGQTLDVVIKGGKFFSGVSSASFGAGITVNFVKVDSSKQITANLTIASSTAAGPRDVAVTNAAPGGGTATLANGFTVNPPATALTKSNEIPTAYLLEQNHPNPFNPSTQIRYELPKSGRVTLTIYDMLGHEVAVLVDEEKPAGRYEVLWLPEGLSSGAYFYRLQAGKFVEAKKMTLAR